LNELTKKGQVIPDLMKIPEPEAPQNTTASGEKLDKALLSCMGEDL
jgi:hypothetical protein